MRIPGMVFLLLAAAGLQASAPRGLPELRRFYADNCVRCHGFDGSATSADGKALKGQSFLDQAFMGRQKDEDLARTILKGKGWGLVMPGFKEQLSPEEARLVVTELLRKAEKGKAL